MYKIVAGYRAFKSVVVVIVPKSTQAWIKPEKSSSATLAFMKSDSKKARPLLLLVIMMDSILLGFVIVLNHCHFRYLFGFESLYCSLKRIFLSFWHIDWRERIHLV